MRGDPAVPFPGAAWPLADRAGATAPARVNPLVRAALYVFVLSIPFEMPNRSFPVEVPTLTAMLLLAAVMLHPGAAFRRIPAALYCFLAYLWIYLMMVVVHRTQPLGLVAELFFNLAILVLLLWVILNLAADERVLWGLLLAFALACVVRASMQVLGIAATAREVYTGGARVTVLGQNANLSAIILSAGLMVVIGLRSATGRPFRWPATVAWPAAALIGLAIIQTGSRGGLLCAGAGLLTYLFTMPGGTFSRRVGNIVAAATAMALLGWGTYRSDMMRHRFEDAEEGHLAGREEIYPAAQGMVLERPWLGWGPIANQVEIAKRIDERRRGRRDAHNLVLELLSATGVVGALPFLGGLALALAAAWRARRGPLGALPLAVLAAVLMGTVSGTWIASKILWLALALAVGAGTHWAASQPAPQQPRTCAA
ncbi:MAG TPA: O-antigen ligase family protein [Gemmatimonadales bacterium]|nr:O-antigen ligase family protein [Gemmatimonadales bacterium]